MVLRSPSATGSGQCTAVHSAQCTEHSAQGTGHSAQGTVQRAQCTVHRAQCTGHSAQGTVHSAQGTVHSAQCTVHSAQCTVHSAQCTAQCYGQWSVHCCGWAKDVPKHLSSCHSALTSAIQLALISTQVTNTRPYVQPTSKLIW